MAARNPRQKRNFLKERVKRGTNKKKEQQVPVEGSAQQLKLNAIKEGIRRARAMTKHDKEIQRDYTATEEDMSLNIVRNKDHAAETSTSNTLVVVVQDQGSVSAAQRSAKPHYRPPHGNRRSSGLFRR